MYQFHSTIVVNASLGDVFEFFSNATNLEKITPPFLNFRIVSDRQPTMQAGLKIDYKLKIHGFPCRWRSEISSWEPPYCFVDEQLKGPYRTWHHTHSFKYISKDQTLVIDDVKYAHIGGKLVNRFFIRPDIEKIFNYRTEAIQKHFKK